MPPFRKILITITLCCPVLSVSLCAADPSGSLPGDSAMTCQQIAAELAPYAQQMAGPAMALAQTDRQIVERGQQRMAQYAPVVAGLSAVATATTADPTGLSAKAYGQAEVAMQRSVWNRSLAEDKPLTDQAGRQLDQVRGQAAQMQANPRIMHLMQLAQQKNCQ